MEAFSVLLAARCFDVGMSSAYDDVFCVRVLIDDGREGVDDIFDALIGRE
jgi:hypothetical protein